jgi:serine/threonine protein kinase
MNHDLPAGPPERSGPLVATTVVITGVTLGGLLGLATTAARGTSPLLTTMLGAALFTAPAVVAAALWIRAGALRVPTRTPYLPGDRFHGWTVVTHRADGVRFDEYELRRGQRAACVTVAANDGDRWSPTANRTLLAVRSRHVAKPLQSGIARTRPYLLVDHSDGRPLTELLGARGNDEFTYEVAVSIMSALRDLHRHDTVHGAVHPDNVLVGDHGVLLCAFDRSRLASADTITVPSVRDDVVGWAEVVHAVWTGRPFIGAFGEPATSDDLATFPTWIQKVVAEALVLVPSAEDILRDLTRAAPAHGHRAEAAPVQLPASPPTITRRAATVGAVTVAAAVALLIIAPAVPPGATAVPPPIPSTALSDTLPTSTTSTSTISTTTTTTSTTNTATAAPTASVTAGWTMPDLVGSNLQDAQDRIQFDTGNPLFRTTSHDGTGAGRRQAQDHHWQVCAQNVPPGARITLTTKIDFTVVKYGETCP